MKKRHKTLYCFVLVIGMLQIIGYLTKMKTIRDLGAVTGSAPLPIVFTEVKGVEAYASDFYLQFKNEKGLLEEIKLTPEIYSKLKGPYNRRNVYGAAIAGAPILPETLWKPILTYGFCNDILKNELQLPVNHDELSVKIITRTKGRSDNWDLKIDCNN